MKDVKELYPDCTKDYDGEECDRLRCVSDYSPIIDELGEVLVQVDDDDYQGDTRVLLKKDGRYGFLNFGWGSCSGCDSLQACESLQQLQSLADGLESDVKWFDTLEEAKNYICSQDREGSYYYHIYEWKNFIEKVKECNG